MVAAEPIKWGQFVCEYKYSCSYATKEKPNRDAAYDINGEGSYTLEVQLPGGKWLCLDATVTVDTWGRLINHGHSSQANIKPFRPLMEGGKWRVAFLALRDIAPGEELFYDYGMHSHAPDWMKRKVLLYLNYSKGIDNLVFFKQATQPQTSPLGPGPEDRSPPHSTLKSVPVGTGTGPVLSLLPGWSSIPSGSMVGSES